MVGAAIATICIGGAACCVYAVWWTLKGIRQAVDSIGR